jgi:hypothetical protein
MRASQRIVAVNSDPRATIVPALVERLRTASERRAVPGSARRPA